MTGQIPLEDLVGPEGEQTLLSKAAEVHDGLLQAEKIYRETGLVYVSDFPEDADESIAYQMNEAAFGDAEDAFVEVIYTWLELTFPHLEAVLQEKIRGIDPPVVEAFVTEMFYGIGSERFEKTSRRLAGNSLVNREQTP